MTIPFASPPQRVTRWEIGYERDGTWHLLGIAFPDSDAARGFFKKHEKAIRKNADDGVVLLKRIDTISYDLTQEWEL